MDDLGGKPTIFGNTHVDFPGCFLPTSWCFRATSAPGIPGRKREELTWKHHSIHAMVEHITKSKRLQPLTVENRWRYSKIPSWETCLKRRFRMEDGTTKIHHPAPVSWKAKFCDHWNQHFPRSGWSKTTTSMSTGKKLLILTQQQHSNVPIPPKTRVFSESRGRQGHMLD